MRTFKPKQEQEAKEQSFRFGPKPLPLDALAGIYARQSTKNQFLHNTESADAQTNDLLALAKRLGWQNDEDVILFIENIGKDGKIRNASGRLRIDQREGLQALVERIEADEIKAVIVAYEDRLFRDETQIQVNVFIDICKRHDTFVITTFRRYDFHDVLDVQMFRMRCEQSAAFLHDYVDRLHLYKAKVSERGQYDGRRIPIGFIVDRRKTIYINGIEALNPTYKRYIPYAPHAQVIRWLFRRFRELGGDLAQLCREVKAMPVVFPSFGEEVDKLTISKCGSLAVEGGYRPTRRGLISILTNVAYIGYWVYQDVVLSKQNHEAIVMEEDFWYAFNRLNDYTPDGDPNPHRKKQSRHARPAAPSQSALVADRITSDHGPVYIIGTPRGINYYGACEQDARYGLSYTTAYPVAGVDELVVEKLLEHLETETQFEDYRQYAKEAQQKIEQSTNIITAQLKETERQLAGLKASLELPPDVLDEETRTDFARKVKRLKGVREALEKKLKEVQGESGVNDLLEYQELMQELRIYWPKIPFVDKKRLANAFLAGVVLREAAPHFLILEIVWKTPSWGIDSAIIWRADGASPKWTEEENAIVRDLFGNTDRATIIEALPRRTWRSIYYQAVNELELPKAKVPNNTPIPRVISWLDYQFMQGQELSYTPVWGSKKVFWLV